MAPDKSRTQSGVRRIDRKSLAERVADELRDLVLLEKLAPGVSIPERETAEALGVSRTPLRESLRILAAEGLVVMSPNRPPTVANPSLSEIGSLLNVQGALEALAGELACEHAQSSVIEEIVELEADMRTASESSDPLDFFQLDMKFHSLIVSASCNKPLIATHRNYNSRLWRARFISSRQRVNRPGTLQQHSTIVHALKNRDASACAKALKAHLQAGFLNIESAMQSRDSNAVEHNNES